MARIVVTGANGFLGTEIVRQAARSGHRVSALVLAGTDASRVRRWVERVFAGDVTRPETLRKALDGADHVVHTAGNTSFYLADRLRQRGINVAGVRNVVEAARNAGVVRLVHTSSVAAVGYDPAGGPVDESCQWNWPSGLPYMESKRDGEREALSAASDSFQVIVLNPATVLGSGPGNPNNDTLVRAVRSGRVVAAPAGAMTVCDLEDVAEAHLAALARGKSGQRYILGGPHVSHRTLLSKLARALGQAPPRLTLPAAVTRFFGEGLRLAEQAGLRPPVSSGALRLGGLDLLHDGSRARAELGFRERGLDEIVERTVTAPAGTGS